MLEQIYTELMIISTVSSPFSALFFDISCTHLFSNRQGKEPIAIILQYPETVERK